MFVILLLLTVLSTSVLGQPGKCDQNPNSKNPNPSENEGIFTLEIVKNEKDDDDVNTYLPDQTYSLLLSTSNSSRPFRSFMITAEDPDVDNHAVDFNHDEVDVGSLKTLDAGSRYSERCRNSVESTDTAPKFKVEIQWVSPKQAIKRSGKVRLRAMIAENDENWYIGEGLETTLSKNDRRPVDSPPVDAKEYCSLCSEARYEVIFKGKWSRISHPRFYPKKPDDNGYSHMIGASHTFQYTVWQINQQASEGLKDLAENANTTTLEMYILGNVSETEGTRTLIRGRRRYHPHMFEPSHSFFRVDRFHHLFSVVIAMKPSPDWFLGTSNFELCTDKGWLEHSEIPLYPWDAGTRNGVSYESATSVSMPVDTVQRVAVGSFDENSPFYQMNLNNLKPFAFLEVRRLDVYPLTEGCEEAEIPPTAATEDESLD